MRLPPCQHLGEPVSSRYAADRGLNPAKSWRHCLHEQQPLGELVCPCKCKRCPMYTRGGDDAAVAAD